ncbi:hypothetical protein BpHYR1_049299 [Brachionus plicatilis]|uniref:Uncharacterized protein n=1 Tax=Brachionus plicatilis TaxID=10195 RepID=A0A3M7SEB0_BRAPC|nr:hypothetical protein BpHYR1_049299 [Brachionus plicatilis]
MFHLIFHRHKILYLLDTETVDIVTFVTVNELTLTLLKLSNSKITTIDPDSVPHMTPVPFVSITTIRLLVSKVKVLITSPVEML